LIILLKSKFGVEVLAFVNNNCIQSINAKTKLNLIKIILVDKGLIIIEIIKNVYIQNG